MPDIVVMFFLLGLVAGIVRSDLEIPKAAYDTISLLLMLTIGLKGGMVLHGSLDASLIFELIAVALLGAFIPLGIMPILQYMVRLNNADTTSIAAHYGSVSAGTFAVVLAYTEAAQISYDPQVTLYLVMLELPAILVALALFRKANPAANAGNSASLWHETFTNRGVILLVGGVCIGFMYGFQEGSAVTELLTGAFKGVLALFLLEIGLTAAETLRPIPWKKWKALVFALLAPLVLAQFGIGLGILLGLQPGSILILATLAASSSYIAAPAAVRAAIPEANIGLAMLMSLGITFPFNVIVGIPLYHQIIKAVTA